jgi:hypothetical protein
MSEEAKVKSLAEKHPAIMAAYENVKRAQDQLKATIILSEEQ